MPTKIIETNPARATLVARKPEIAVSIPLTIKDGFKVERGDTLGVITASGYGRRRTNALAAGAGFATNAATGEVDDASVFAVGDVLKNAAGTTIGTVQAVNTTTDVVTLTGNAAVAVAAGARVLGSDGSQVAQAISDDESDGDGDAVASVFVSALLTQSKLRGLDVTAKAELGGASVAGGIFKF